MSGPESRYGPGSALVVVDMQVDFGSPDGGLYVDSGEETIPIVNQEVVARRGRRLTGVLHP